MRQFDIFIRGTKGDIQTFRPPFTDKALEWFYNPSFNANANKTEAEWIVFVTENVLITREFLNALAECIASFPAVDAFTPAVRFQDQTFERGFLLSKKDGLKMMDENSLLRFAAAPHPEIVAISRRAFQRTGLFDESLPPTLQTTDFAFRLLHAGCKLFYVPYLVAEVSTKKHFDFLKTKADRESLIQILFKSFGLQHIFKQLLKHPQSILPLWKNRKSLVDKREKAILLSKLSKSFLKDIKE